MLNTGPYGVRSRTKIGSVELYAGCSRLDVLKGTNTYLVRGSFTSKAAMFSVSGRKRHPTFLPLPQALRGKNYDSYPRSLRVRQIQPSVETFSGSPRAVYCTSCTL